MIYEAPRDPAEVLKVRGVGRVSDEPRAILVMLSERPTDDEMRALHDYLRTWPDNASAPALLAALEECAVWLRNGEMASRGDLIECDRLAGVAESAIARATLAEEETGNG